MIFLIFMKKQMKSCTKMITLCSTCSESNESAKNLKFVTPQTSVALGVLAMLVEDKVLDQG